MELRIFTDILENRQQLTEFQDILKSVYLMWLPEVDDSDDIGSLLEKTISTFQKLRGAFHEPFENNALGETEGFWKEAIKAQCIVSATYTLEETLLSNADVIITARDFMKNFSGRGLLCARREGKITDDCKNMDRTVTTNSTGDTAAGNIASAKISSIRKQFNDEEYRTFFKNHRPVEEKSNYVNDIKLSDYDVLEALMRFREKSDKGRMVDYFAKKIHRLYRSDSKAVTALEYVRYFDQACQDALGRVPREKDPNEKKMDYLIKVYKLERYYNFSLNKTAISCFIDCCKEHNDILWDYLDNDFYELFWDMSCMSNVFSRDIMCRWLFKQLDKRLVGELDAATEVHEWLKDSKKFIHFTSKVLVPFAERTFMSLLIERYGCTDIPSIWRGIDELVDYIGKDGKYFNILEPCLTYVDGRRDGKFDKYPFNKDIQTTQKAGKIDSAPLYDEIQLRAYNREYDEIIVGNYSYTAWSTENKNKEYISEYNYGFKNSDMSEMTYEEKKDYAENLLEKAGATKTIIIAQEKDSENGFLDKHRLELFIIKMRRMNEISEELITKKRKVIDAFLCRIIDGEMCLGRGYAPVPSIFDREWLENKQEIRSKIVNMIVEKGLEEWTLAGNRKRQENQDSIIRSVITETKNSEVKVRVERE